MAHEIHALVAWQPAQAPLPASRASPTRSSPDVSLLHSEDSSYLCQELVDSVVLVGLDAPLPAFRQADTALVVAPRAEEVEEVLERLEAALLPVELSPQRGTPSSGLTVHDADVVDAVALELSMDVGGALEAGGGGLEHKERPVLHPFCTCFGGETLCFGWILDPSTGSNRS